MAMIYLLFAFVILLPLGGAALLGYIAYKMWQVASRLRQQGVQVTGKTIEKRDFQPSRGSRQYYVKYSYEHGGMKYRREQAVRKGHYEAWSQGTNVAVLCLPANPDVSRLVDDNTSAVQMYAFAFGAAVLLAGAIAITIVVIVMPMRV